MASGPNSNKDCLLAWEAMPDALHGALTPRQGEWLESHLAHCESCREQFASQQRLQRALSLPTGLPIDEEASLQRLLSRIDNPDIEPARHASRSTGLVMRGLVAAVLVLATGLGVTGAMLWSLRQSAPEYRTLGQEAAALPAHAIRLVPDPSMTVADWDALLAANALQVVAGPNAVGGYTVAPISDVAGRGALVQRLRGTRGVLLAEPAAGTP